MKTKQMLPNSRQVLLQHELKVSYAKENWTDLQSSHHQKKKKVTEVMEVLTNFIMVIISQ